MRYWKVLNGTRAEHTGFDFTPYLPVNGQYGAVLPTLDNVVVCERGWHFSTDVGLRTWLRTEDVYVAIGTGKSDAGGHHDKRAFASGRLGPHIVVTPRTFALYALEALNSLPIGKMSAGQRTHLDNFREDLFKVVVGTQDIADLDADSEDYELVELAERLEEAYDDYARKMPAAVVAECKALRDLGDNPFSELRSALVDADNDIHGLICHVPEAVKSIHRMFKGPLTTDEKAYGAFGDVLEGELLQK